MPRGDVYKLGYKKHQENQRKKSETQQYAKLATTNPEKALVALAQNTNAHNLLPRYLNSSHTTLEDFVKRTDKNGNSIKLLDVQLYEDLFSGKKVKKKFYTMIRNLFDEVKISSHKMSRTLKYRNNN